MLTKADLTKTQLAALTKALNNHRAWDASHGHDPDQTMTIQDWLDLYNDQEGRCAWTLQPLTIPDRLTATDRTGNSHKLTLASVDRVCCQKGHTVENSMLVTITANLGRNNIQYEMYWDYMHGLTGRKPMFGRDPNAFE